MEKNKNKKTNIILRVDELEKHFIEQKAAQNNYKSVSEFIRNSLITPEKNDLKRMRGMLYEVNKIGTNLNQISYKLNKNGCNDDELKQLLEVISFQTEEVLKTYKKL